MTDQLIGQHLDEYRLDALLGQGGMARVYRAFDVNLKRWAAIKVIDAPFRADADYIKRFEREARAIAQLKHHHIVSLYRYGKVKKVLYIAMEYIKGQDLEIALAPCRSDRKPFPAAQSGRIVRQVGEALDYAHRKGVIHRDIKPSNIMVDNRGDAILTDFGLVLLDDRQTMGEAFGTPHYIAPEQAISSAGAVPQSDLYALGVIMYEMFTGQWPFNADHPYDLAMMHLADPPPPPRALNGNISGELEAVILKALAKDPEKRYPSGAALADALDQVLKPSPIVNLPKNGAAPTVPRSTSSLVGSKLGRYTVAEKLSENRVADVYRGCCKRSGGDVAIKLFSTYSTANGQHRERFNDKAQALVKLRHPHLVPVHEFGIHDGLHYMISEYVTGGTLRSWLAKRLSSGKTIPLAGVGPIVRSVAAALDYAHRHDIVHSDLRPGNIMLTRTGQLVLTDLGLTNLMHAADQTILSHTLRGAAYMSPEQAVGRKGSKSCDIYALGAMLFELVTGRVPFEADTPFDTLLKHRVDPVPSVRNINPQLPLAVEQVILKALAKGSDARYPTAGALAVDLIRAIRERM